jgi:hypothetical protein
MTDQGERTLSDADVEAIAAQLKEQLRNEFIRGAGVGVLRFAWKGLTYLIVGLAVYAWSHHGGAR